MPRKRTTPAAGAIYVAVESFATDLDGIPTNVTCGLTTVREGHPLLDRFPDFFRPLKPTYEYEVEERWEMATAAPGEVRS